ncbi:MAG: hypothetical protein GY772_28030, partial [bacterium]|nr:hypothetical protein [bacterium]
LPLLHFVLEQGGAGTAGYVDGLVAFHEKFVNPKTRRLREGHFRVVCALPEPLLRGALLKAAYGCKPGNVRDGWIDYFGPKEVAMLAQGQRRGVALEASAVLQRFHVEYRQRGVYRALTLGEATLALGRLDMELGRVLLARDGLVCSTVEIAAVAAKHDAELRSRLPAETLAKLPEAFVSDAPASSSAPASLVPRVIEYSDCGVALTRQHELLQATETLTTLDWHSSLETPAMEFERARTALFARLCGAAAAMPAVDSKLLSVTQRGPVPSVTAVLKIKAGTLLLFPLVPTVLYVVADAQHPGRVPTGVVTGRGELFLTPAFKPPLRSAGSGGCARGSPEAIGFMPPFWAVRRSEREDEANCVLACLPVELVTSIAAGEKPFKLQEPMVMRHDSSTVPVLCNRATIQEGGELVLLNTVPRPKPTPSRRCRTWVDEQHRISQGKRNRPSRG